MDIFRKSESDFDDAYFVRLDLWISNYAILLIALKSYRAIISQ